LRPSLRVLDAGCGTGGNFEAFIEIFTGAGLEVFAVDADADAAATARESWKELKPRPRVAAACCEALPFADGIFDAFFCLVVLHFAGDAAEFEAMLAGAWRVLRVGGVFLGRMDCRGGRGEDCRGEASFAPAIFAPTKAVPWFFADQGRLESLAADLGADWLEPYAVETRGDRAQAVIQWRKERIAV
jgi:SAM-dependent methyltransferase